MLTKAVGAAIFLASRLWLTFKFDRSELFKQTTANGLQHYKQSRKRASSTILCPINSLMYCVALNYGIQWLHCWLSICIFYNWASRNWIFYSLTLFWTSDFSFSSLFYLSGFFLFFLCVVGSSPTWWDGGRQFRLSRKSSPFPSLMFYHWSVRGIPKKYTTVAHTDRWGNHNFSFSFSSFIRTLANNKTKLLNTTQIPS